MLKDNHEELEGNDKFQGFCVEMLDAISKSIGFRYKIQLVEDGKYGVPDELGHWNGMVKELIDGVSTAHDGYVVIQSF
jgi:ionotropic kainate glutamate receptor 4